MNKQTYVLGFIFSEDLNKVLLLRKNRAPEDAPQILGKLNGIGGHYELSDNTPMDAMERECKEETGLEVEWTYFAELRMKYGDMFCFYSVVNDVFEFEQKEDEELGVYSLEEYIITSDYKQFLPNPEYYKTFPYMPNLAWLLEMARNHFLKLDGASGFIIKEEYE